MKTLGIFEVKTKLSRICETVAKTREPVLITVRGTPLVRIDPIESSPLSIKERRAIYMTKYGGEEKDDTEDFSPAPRSRERIDFDIGEEA